MHPAFQSQPELSRAWARTPAWTNEEAARPVPARAPDYNHPLQTRTRIRRPQHSVVVLAPPAPARDVRSQPPARQPSPPARKQPSRETPHARTEHKKTTPQSVHGRPWPMHGSTAPKFSDKDIKTLNPKINPKKPKITAPKKDRPK
jgi:hypothetical protein